MLQYRENGKRKTFTREKLCVPSFSRTMSNYWYVVHASIIRSKKLRLQNSLYPRGLAFCGEANRAADYVNTWLKIKKETSGWQEYVGNDPTRQQEHVPSIIRKKNPA